VKEINPVIVQMIVERSGHTVDAESVMMQLRSDRLNDMIVAYNLLLDTNPQLRGSDSFSNLLSAASDPVSASRRPTNRDLELEALKAFASSPPMNLRGDESLIPVPGMSKSLQPASPPAFPSPMEMSTDGTNFGYNTNDNGMNNHNNSSNNNNNNTMLSPHAPQQHQQHCRKEK
jgi:hypothetical protein